MLEHFLLGLGFLFFIHRDLFKTIYIWSEVKLHLFFVEFHLGYKRLY